MSDLAIGGLIVGLLIVLAVTAPIWGYDSRDGIESDQAARRVAWLQPHNAGVSGPRPAYGATMVVAGALRSMAYHLDGDAAAGAHANGQVAHAS